MARIPPKTVSADDEQVLAGLENELKRVVYGQDTAISALSSAIKLARAGLREPEKPIGCYLFSGPTGVGKTEVAKQLAVSLGVELLRFDMSEYMERHTVSRLIGAPPGYVGFDQGGLLTDGVDQHPHCVLLLDEVEKAHPDLFNILLQVMDHGKLTDHNGKQIDFRNVILIMTTNAGASDAQRAAIGFGSTKREGDDVEAINRLFTPEFRNRLDAIIPFGSLPIPVVHQVVQKFVMQLEAQLSERGVTFDLSPEAIAWLADKGYDERMGARPLGRVIQEHIKKPLADEVLFGKLKKGGTVRVTVETKEGGETGLKLESLADELPVKPKKEEPKRDAAPRKAGGEASDRARSRPSHEAEGSAGRQGRRQAQPGAATAAQGLSGHISEDRKPPAKQLAGGFWRLGRSGASSDYAACISSPRAHRQGAESRPGHPQGKRAVVGASIVGRCGGSAVAVASRISARDDRDHRQAARRRRIVSGTAPGPPGHPLLKGEGNAAR